MNIAGVDGGNSYWQNFLFRLLNGGVISICFLGFAAGIVLYRQSSANYFNSHGEAGNEVSASAISTVAAAEAGNTGERIDLLFPPDNYLLSSAHTPDLYFSWKNPFQYPALFQIASRSDFAGALVVEERLAGAAHQGRFLSPGVYYWRVSVTIPSYGRIDTAPQRLVVIPSFGAPEIFSPREFENVKITDGIPVDFRWEKQSFADTYDFKLFSVGSNIPLYEVSSLRDTVVQAYFNPRTSGRYRWTVQANTVTTNEVTRKRGLIKDHYFTIGTPGVNSSSGFVRGVIKAGAVHAPITLLNPWVGASFVNSPLSRLQARWSADENLINSRVIFSRDQDPAADPRAVILYLDEGVTSITLPALGEGVWYWIVQGETSHGQSLSAAVPSWFTILPPHPLDSPNYLRPGEQEVITLDQLMMDRNITFMWEEVPEANAYIFTLFEAGEERMVFSGPPSPGTSFKLSDLAILTANDYTWQVEAVSVSRNGTIERRGAISRSSFVIHVPHSENLRTGKQGTQYGY